MTEINVIIPIEEYNKLKAIQSDANTIKVLRARLKRLNDKVIGNTDDLVLTTSEGFNIHCRIYKIPRTKAFKAIIKKNHSLQSERDEAIQQTYDKLFEPLAPPTKKEPFFKWDSFLIGFFLSAVITLLYLLVIEVSK